MFKETLKFIGMLFAFITALHLVHCEWHDGVFTFQTEIRDHGETEETEQKRFP